MSFGQSWNLHCSRCRHSWISKIYGPEVTCPVCEEVFEVAYSDFSQAVKAFHTQHQEKMKRRGLDVAQEHVEPRGRS